MIKIIRAIALMMLALASFGQAIGGISPVESLSMVGGAAVLVLVAISRGLDADK